MTLDRRRFLTACSQAGITSALLPGVLFTLVSQRAAAENTSAAAGNAAAEKPVAFPAITGEMLDQAAIVAGVGPFSVPQKQMMLDGLNGQRDSIEPIRAFHLANSVAPAFVFHPLAAAAALNRHGACDELAPSDEPVVTPADDPGTESEAIAMPANIEQLAFASIRELGALLRERKVTSLALTKMYLARLKRYDPKLHFVITLTEERALAQARAADAELAAGNDRGPLHGIPWGAKDLLAVKGYRTTWGAGGFETQSFDEDATVVKRLDQAGAVLVAKLSLGQLAMNDKWFGGRTRNPWNPTLGSSGSSAGSASAVSAGCVGFAIGSETLGSISSPSTRCGVTGLRPTFGFVPRTGAMALSWTMDKLGPIARTAEDCALILNAIHGPDGKDASVYGAKFAWLPTSSLEGIRIGYLKSEFDAPPPVKLIEAAPNESAEQQSKREEQNRQMQDDRARRVYNLRFENAALDKLRAMGYELKAVELPPIPYDTMVPLLMAEAAASFDELTRTGRDRLLTEQGPDDWPNGFRVARFYPAVEYIQANRLRSLAVAQLSALFQQVDIIATPSAGAQLTATNLTGHPALILPIGLRGKDAVPPPKDDSGDNDDIGGPGTPMSITFLAGHYQDARLAAFGRAFQQATGHHKLHPKLD